MRGIPLKKPGEAVTRTEKTSGLMWPDSRSKDKFGTMGENIAAMINASRGGAFDPRPAQCYRNGRNRSRVMAGTFCKNIRQADKTFSTALLSAKSHFCELNSNINGYDETGRRTSAGSPFITTTKPTKKRHRNRSSVRSN